MHEIVIVIPDLYLAPDAERGAAAAFAAHGTLPGIEYAGRFGERAALASGWREWLAGSLGRADLKGLAPACIAAAVCEGAAGAPQQGAGATWIAAPVQLIAGLTRVHLDHRGLLSLPHAEQAALATGFQRLFGPSGHELTPLPSGDFLLRTCGIAAVATSEPARCAGGEVAHALGQGAAAPLRRLLAEIEMWLHGLALNEERQQRGASLITALWLWGAEGRVLRPGRGSSAGVQSAYGSEAYLNGLWHLQGGAPRALPAWLDAVLAEGAQQRAVLVLTVGGELQSGFQGTVAQALARLDERFISPALKALRRGELRRVTLILNDTRVALGRASGLRLWRRARRGLEGFA
jgi:hypothetical protein